MSPLRARVENGRLILDEPTTLPDGTIVDLVADDEGDDLTDEERRALHAALSASWTSAGRSPAARLGDPRRTASASVNLSVTTTPEADAQIRTIDDWWRANRGSSHDLFLDELAGAFELIAGAPHLGRPYRRSPSQAPAAFC